MLSVWWVEYKARQWYLCNDVQVAKEEEMKWEEVHQLIAFMKESCRRP